MALQRRSSPITAAGPRWIRTTFPFVRPMAGHRQSRPIHLSNDPTLADTSQDLPGCQGFFERRWSSPREVHQPVQLELNDPSQASIRDVDESARQATGSRPLPGAVANRGPGTKLNYSILFVVSLPAVLQQMCVAGIQRRSMAQVFRGLLRGVAGG